LSAYAEHLSREGENLALVTEFLYKRHRPLFDKILEKLKHRVPGIASVEPKITDEGRVLLRFKDGAFEDPFLAHNVSDGTIKMFAYLVLLNDPSPHPLLAIEEPENQLYHSLLPELAEEFRDYSRRGGQVFIATHSPDLLNAIELDEAFWLEKIKGYTCIKRARDDPQIARFIILRDQDSGECVEVKSRLAALCAQAGSPQAVVRIACRELESWYLADLEAVALAYEKPTLAREAGKPRYRDPDAIDSPSQELRRILPEYQKIEGSRRIGALIDPDNQRSRSFHHLVSSIRRLVEELPV